MKFVWIILFVLLILLLLWGSFAWGMFQKALGRYRPKGTPEDRIQGPYAPCRESLCAGIRWLRGQPVQEVEIRSREGLRLRGELLPLENARGTVLLFHGYHGDIYMDLGVAARLYRRLGFQVLCIHQRAHGKSEGKYLAMGLRERYDAAAWADYAARELCPGQKLILAGVSMGAATVLMASDLPLPEAVKGIVADCGFASPWEECLYVASHWKPLPYRALLGTANVLCRIFAGYDLREWTAPQSLARTTIPVCLFHGEEDRFVPVSCSRENYAACASPCQLHLYPGAGHCLSYHVDPARYSGELADFLDACCAGEALPGSGEGRLSPQAAR